MNTLNVFEMEKREEKLYIYQDKNRQAVKDHLESLGYEIKKIDSVSDGWLDGFRVDRFHVKDRRDGREFVLVGNDDNTSLFENYECGGRGLWKSIPETDSFYSC